MEIINDIPLLFERIIVDPGKKWMFYLVDLLIEQAME